MWTLFYLTMIGFCGLGFGIHASSYRKYRNSNSFLWMFFWVLLALWNAFNLMSYLGAA